MVTKKTLSCACENCTCDPCECTKGESCQKRGGCCGVSWAGWTRIAIAVLLIVGAYIAGVMAGTCKEGYSMKGEGGYRGGYEGRKLSEKKMMMNANMNMNHDPMSMSMADMGKMLEGKTGDELNKAFLEGMIPHHQGAINMAKYLAGSNKPELVKLGADIITAQQKEIDQMKQWIIDWGYTSTGSTMTGMMDHSMMNHE